MTGFNCILIPLDGSERAEAALSWAHLLPADRIRLLQVCPPEEANGAASTTYLADVAARLAPPGATVDIRVAYGEPAEVIVSEAAETDLIVMSTQGAGDGGRRLFGSAADRIARHAPVPTLLLRGGRAPVVAEQLRRIVVPLDGSAAAERALPLAMKLAGMLDTRVHLISVMSAAADVDAGEYLERQAASIQAHEAVISTEVRSGTAGDELLAAVEPGDLLVITTHGRGEARRWQIGRVAERLLRHASAPIVLVRADSI